MRWSRSILKSETTSEVVLDFVPQNFNLGTPEQAMEYLRQKEHGSDFRMNDVLRVQTGVEQIEDSSEELRIEEKSLEKLKEIQEAAYAEAFELGLDEGRKQAFEKTAKEIEVRLNELDTHLLNIKSMKTEMAGFNEAHLLKLMFHMASRIAMERLAENNNAILEVLKQSVQLAQDEENIRVQVSSSQFEFLEELKKQTGREVEFMKKMKFEPNPEITSGGCIVATNYGEVDARVEQRLDQLWNLISESLPRVKDVVGR